MFKEIKLSFTWNLAWIVLLTIAWPVSLNAQTAHIRSYLRPETPIHKRSNETFSGSPYFNESWETGRIFLSSGKKSKKINLKYKPYNNHLLYKEHGELKSVIPKSMTGFSLNHKGDQLLFKTGFNAPRYNIKSNQIIQVLHNGHVKLLKQHKIKLQRDQSRDPLTGELHSRYLKTEDYFLIDKNNNFHKIDLKRDDVLKALPKYNNEIKNYAQTKDLSFENEKDLQKILKEYDKMFSEK